MSITVGQLLSKGKERLGSAGLEDPDISAELLLRSILQMGRSQLILSSSQIVSNSQEIEYNNLLEKRARHVPLQYLTGRVDFYNVRLKCDSRALIPRPETEILVDTIISKSRRYPNLRILDIGTGSGNIAISLAKTIHTDGVMGIDISGAALELASDNARLNRVESRIEFRQGDISDREFLASLGKFDCVVSNPPYVADGDKESLQLEITQFEPEIAVFAGGDPLRFFKTIIGSISYILNSGGLLGFEIGMGQADAIRQAMEEGFSELEVFEDLAGIERVITGIYAGSH
jgi:release factor glutamine methyltransferase